MRFGLRRSSLIRRRSRRCSHHWVAMGAMPGTGPSYPSVFSWQLSPQWFVGLGLNAPFGLKTEYDPTWVGRFHAIKSELKTINVNPSIAFKVNDTFSLGAGVNYQRVNATLSNAVNYSAAAFGAGGLLTSPRRSKVSRPSEGDDNTWGYNLGAMLNLNPEYAPGPRVSFRHELHDRRHGHVYQPAGSACSRHPRWGGERRYQTARYRVVESLSSPEPAMGFARLM